MRNLIKIVFGDKHTKDFKILSPIVEEINAEYEKIKDFSDEQLKAKTIEFKEKIQLHTEELRNKISELKLRLQSNEDDMDRHLLYDELDELEEQLNEKYEDILAEILPEAFAVVKSTCQRLVGKSWTIAGL